MKRFATLFVALGLATAGSTALAEQAKDQVTKQNAKPQPVQMTDAQLDNVAAGLINLLIVDFADVNVDRTQVNVGVPVVANAAVAVLGIATAAQSSRVVQSPSN